MAVGASGINQLVFIDCVMESHPDIARGLYKGDRVKLNQLWSDLTNQLNASGRPTRNISNWKKIWCDWKRSIKTRLSINKMSLKKNGRVDYQQHFLSPVEEQLAIICNIFHAVEGVAEAKSFGAETKKKQIEIKEDMQIEIEPVIESVKPNTSLSSTYARNVSPKNESSFQR
ncbi:hypothetical protein DOY81_008758 [Sarcophaga bullata]|nr:hypothetical protein DOY81_008758 [Sarcophaga bullata]